MKNLPGISLLLLVSVMALMCACGKAKSPAYRAADVDYIDDSTRFESLQRTASVRAGAATAWEGTGFNGEVFDGQVPPATPHAPAPSAEVQIRKLVKTAELRIKVEDPAAAEKPLADLMEKYGAWTASTAIYENSRDYSIRVPSPSYDAMLADLAGLGKTLRRTETTEDVTLRYYDLEGRLATKRELLKTYQGYLGKAKNIDEIMTVESRIADLQQEIDGTGTQLRNLASLVDYSTIGLKIAGPQSSSYSEPNLWEKMGRLFGNFGDLASSALVALMAIIIYGVPAILVLILLFWVLFGRIGLIKKVWRLAAGKKAAAPSGDKPAAGPSVEL